MITGQATQPICRYAAWLTIVLGLAGSACSDSGDDVAIGPKLVVISVVGINDVHGELSSSPGRGGLTTLSGYVDALRALRAESEGGVLLIDAGDMWQGTLDSNLNEGAAVVSAFNALGVAAAAIGNHEFDFGPVGPMAIPQSDADDPQGALKLRATEAEFPLLAANLIDLSTNLPVDWPNVQPSTMVEVAGINIGIIGVMTERALAVSIAANTVGLRVAPLTETIIREARILRDNGASLVIVTAHAGSFCEDFDDPMDLSSCDLAGEIMRVASELPPGLVDHINAGHVHRGIAHVVNGVSITSSFASTRAFSRVDFTLDKNTGEIQQRQVFAPHDLCSFTHTDTGQCASPDDDLDTIVVARYEGYPILPNSAVAAIADNAATIVNKKKTEKLGIVLDTAITLEGGPESALGNLLTDAVLQSIDADIYLHNVVGGIRANLPAGELTFGKVFNIMPFDNRVVVLDLSGAELRRIMEKQAHRTGLRAGFSGMRVYVECTDDQMAIRMNLADGRDIEDNERVMVAVSDFLALGGDGILQPAMPDEGFQYSNDLPLIRDVLVDWFTKIGQQEGQRQVVDLKTPRWILPDFLPASCAL